MSKSESDQEDNDDLNDNDWSYGAEKKGEHWNIFYHFHSAKRDIEGNSKLIRHNKHTSCFLYTAKKRKSDKVFWRLFSFLQTVHFMFLCVK